MFTYCYIDGGLVFSPTVLSAIVSGLVNAHTSAVRATQSYPGRISEVRVQLVCLERRDKGRSLPPRSAHPISEHKLRMGGGQGREVSANLGDTPPEIYGAA